MFGGSGEKAVLGGELFVIVCVTQFDSAPLLDVDQPDGKAGAVTVSKLWVKIVPVWPMINGTLTLPRLVDPSCNWRVALSVLPQAAPAEKLNACVTAFPPLAIT